MAVKRAAVKAPVKKTAAKKSASTKKSSASKSPSTGEKADLKSVEAVAETVCSAIAEGKFDSCLAKFDDALNARLSAQAAARKRAPSAAPAERKVAAAPKRKSKPAVNLEEGKTYLISSASKNIGGAKVKFHRYKVDAPEKAVVELMTDKPGYPKGKRVVVLATSLENVKK